MKALLIKICLLSIWLASAKALALDVFMRNQPIQNVLPHLAAELEQSVIIDESIAANVTLAIRDATWPEIMAAIAAQLQLELTWQGDIAILAPKPIVLSSQTDVVEEQCEHAIWHLKHAKAVTVGTYLKQYFSDLGTIIDPRTNAIMTRYCGAPETLAMAFEWLDSPTRQIEIGAEIAQVSDSVQEQLGVNWHARLLDQSQTSILGDVDLGVAAAPVNLGIAGVTGNLALSATLDWLERQGSANVLARPKIVTAEGQPARIESGTEVPYQVVDDDNVSVEFRQAGLMLEVTPQVKDETTLLLNLKIHQDSVGEMVNGVPSIETNRVQTQVEVKNGETLVLGGIYREETFININKVPVLGDVPLMGALFRQETQQQEKVELLVFITPKLLKMSVN